MNKIISEYQVLALLVTQDMTNHNPIILKILNLYPYVEVRFNGYPVKTMKLYGNEKGKKKIVVCYLDKENNNTFLLSLSECFRKIFTLKHLKSILFIGPSGYNHSPEHEKLLLESIGSCFLIRPDVDLAILDKKYFVVSEEPKKLPHLIDDFHPKNNEKSSIKITPTYKNGIKELFNNTFCQGWSNNLFDDVDIQNSLNYIDKITRFDADSGTEIFPPPEDMLNAFIFTPLEKLNVIIIGQDPYHTTGAAMGLAFSHPSDYNKLQPSLNNIYKELGECGFKYNKKNGDLRSWAKQGVLLINTALTVKKGEPESYLKEWKEFTTLLFGRISEIKSKKGNKIVVVLWGSKAQSFEKIFRDRNHIIVKSGHPSPMSSHLFFGSRPFLRINDELEKIGKEKIDWNL